MRKPTEINQRPIRTVYYQTGKVVKITHSKWANTAVPNSVSHMQVNQYNATHCEVFDSASGTLHAVIKKKMHGIEILFKRDVKEGM
jgi:hypothetical protein